MFRHDWVIQAFQRAIRVCTARPSQWSGETAWPRQFSLVGCLVLAVLLPGCASFFAKQAIERFAESLQEQDLDELKASTSSGFEQKALRRPEAVSDLKMLRVPQGKIEIVSVDEIDESTKLAVVKVGEEERALDLEYRLKIDRNSGRWVVDDVILNRDVDGDDVRRSVTEQMDLLLTCRDFLSTWNGGQRSEKLAFCAPILQQELEVLPPNWLKVLSEQIVGSGRQRTFRPEARLDRDRAVVVVPHPDGDLFLKLRQSSERWMVEDLAIEPDALDETGVRSLIRLGKGLNQTARFLTAFASEDHKALSETASHKFFHQCLAAADLQSVALPVPALLADAYEFRQFRDRIEMLLDGPEATYMLTLIQEENAAEDDKTSEGPTTRIDEVTIFDGDDAEVKRMSAMFLSHAIVQLYSDALLDRDLDKLQEISSADFRQRVWDQDFAAHFPILPFPQLDDGEIEVITTLFRGDVTEVTLARGENVMTFVLHLARGWMVVDDVMMPAIDRPTSLKENLELMLPLYAFATATMRRDLQALVKESADGLDRMVWLQLNEFPEFHFDMARPLMSEVISITPGEPWKTVRTSDGLVQAEVRLLKEGSRYVVHDVNLSREDDPTLRVELIQAMRDRIAARQGRSRLRDGGLQQAGGFDIDGDQRVQQAVFEPIERAIYSQTQ